MSAKSKGFLPMVRRLKPLLNLVRHPRLPHAFASARRGRGLATTVTLSEERLKEFMQAEIGYFGGMSAEPVDMKEIFKASVPETAAELVLRQLPFHFASRLKQIEALEHWESVPELVQVHNILSESFRNLRLVELSSDLEPLTSVVRDVRKRHKAIVPLLGIAMKELCRRGYTSETNANEWLNTFFLARISTEMCTLHYIMLVSGEDGGAGRAGIIDTHCDPSAICRQAVANVQRDPRYSSVPMPVESFVCSSSEKGIEFSFLPQYLLMIVEELLKNSAYATIMHARSSSSSSRPLTKVTKTPQHPPVCVFVGADDRQVMIEVSDKGGGIPAENVDKIWSYAKTSQGPSPGSLSSIREEPLGTSWADPLSGLGLKERLGMGLPLTRLYTQYLGGSLELMSIPGVGVDTFINLKRIGPDVSEEVPKDPAS